MDGKETRTPAQICPDTFWADWIRDHTATAVSYLQSASIHFQDVKARSYDALGLKAGAVVLDVGCGLGQDARELMRLVGAQGQVVGADYSEEMVAEARRRAKDGSSLPKFVVSEAHHLGFSNNTFDASRADRVLQHLADPRAAFEEMVRVTKAGGTVQIIDRDWGLVAVDADDQAVTRKILDHICAKIRNGWIGRRVPVLFQDSGLQEVRVEAIPITVRDFRVADILLDLTLVAGHAADERIVSSDDKKAWLLELQERSDAGRFFAAWVMFIVTGKKAV
ncbi:MAG TPA: methyltransferase domain-containing protein [Candidatus Binatus sp.]|uniref:methyltransferase domain-containing protein n=1 Tax=Candidatus Binatus sp. TaxID=2811406 RepID=UPI002F404CFE